MKRTLIIAEAGVNHNGNLELAYKMVDAAKEAGVDIVKFQTAIPKNVVTVYADKADYQKVQTGSGESQLEMIERISLKYDDFVKLKAYCEQKEITFLSTPFDIDSIFFLDSLGMEQWKIPSGEITNYPYLIEIAKTGKPIILSTGMSTMEEIKVAMELLHDNGSGPISLLHCNSQYPTPYEDVNLRAMDSMRETFEVEVGYSDHSLGIEVPIAAVAMGATIIEKHFTLDRTMEGPDHQASLEPDELKQMVISIRNIEKALGCEEKRVSDSERSTKAIARKSIVAKCAIKKGEVFTSENLTTKRPGDGVSPMLWPQVLGSKAIRDFEEDEKIEL